MTVPGDNEEEEVGYPAWPCELGRKLEAAANEEESLRLLYVACTRAEELLILSSGVAGAVHEATGPWMEALARAYDLMTGASRISGTEPVEVRSIGDLSVL